MTTATHANEANYAIGYDYDAAFEAAEFEAEQEAERDRWEREGAAEIRYTLFGEWEV
jgi:hypothetical protein